MCLKCEMKKALAAKLLGIQIEEVSKGFVSKETVDELAVLETASDKLKAEIDVEIKEAARRVMEEIQQKYQKKIDDLADLQRKVIDEAIEKLGLDTAQEYGIDRKTGEVTQEIIR